MDEGFYCHFGMQNCLEKMIFYRILRNEENRMIKLHINIDGAPLGQSSEKSLWPILCAEYEHLEVFIIGVFADTLDKNLRHDRHINVPSSADNSNDDSMQHNADEPLAIIPLIPPTEEGGHENTRSDSSSSSFESSLSRVEGDTEMEKENDIFTPPISIDQTPSISTSAAPTLSASKSTAPTFSASTSSGHVNSREKTSVEMVLGKFPKHTRDEIKKSTQSWLQEAKKRKNGTKKKDWKHPIMKIIEIKKLKTLFQINN
ncbi:hypothetical protein TKK_0015448 [Trichogramma kaykai]